MASEDIKDTYKESAKYKNDTVANNEIDAEHHKKTTKTTEMRRKRPTRR